MNSPDHDTLIRAVEDARRILGNTLSRGRGTQRERWNVCWLYSIEMMSFTRSIE
jgi:hypothetical protein